MFPLGLPLVSHKKPEWIYESSQAILKLLILYVCIKLQAFRSIQTSVLWKRKRMYQQYEIEKRQVRTVSLEESSGYIAAEFIYLHSPYTV
mgnify:CR=1 FL=1